MPGRIQLENRLAKAPRPSVGVFYDECARVALILQYFRIKEPE
jgi:hypothetical protein